MVHIVSVAIIKKKKKQPDTKFDMLSSYESFIKTLKSLKKLLKHYLRTTWIITFHSLSVTYDAMHLMHWKEIIAEEYQAIHLWRAVLCNTLPDH